MRRSRAHSVAVVSAGLARRLALVDVLRAVREARVRVALVLVICVRVRHSAWAVVMVSR